MHRIKTIIFFTIILIKSAAAQQPDTLKISIKDAEKRFLQNNFSLLAAQYNVDANTALIKQAKLWDNPVISTNQTLYDGRFFNHSKTGGTNSGGEVDIQLQQLIKTAGKRSKLAKLATTNANISQLQLNQLVLNLRYTLHDNLYQVNQLLQTLQLNTSEAEQINKLLAGMEAQFKAGNISQKDFLRIQALQLNLQVERSEYQKQLNDIESELHTLLRAQPNQFIYPVDLQPINNPAPINADSLFAVAKKSNPDYLLQQTNLLYQQQGLDYQKSLRVPDVTVGAEYDKASAYTPNYYGLLISLPLPVLNRNQGNIASAAFTVKQGQALVSQQETKLLNDIYNTINNLKINYEFIQGVNVDFQKKYQQLVNNAIAAYQQRQLGLFEFIDLFDAYKESQIKFFQHQYNLQKSREDLNVLVGQDVF